MIPKPKMEPSLNSKSSSSSSIDLSLTSKPSTPPGAASSSGSGANAGLPRIRRGLLSRAGSEAEDRAGKAESPLLTSDDDETGISDSAPLPRRFAQVGKSSSVSRPSQLLGGRTPLSDFSGGSDSGTSLGRAKSVSSVSSVNSTSSLEAAPFKEAPLGNLRVGFGGLGGLRQVNGSSRLHGMTASDLPLSSCYSRACPSPAQAEKMPFDETGRGQARRSQFERHKGVPKTATDAWIFRNGPGMKSGKGKYLPLQGPTQAEDVALPPIEANPTPPRKGGQALRQKFSRGAGKLGMRNFNGLNAPAPSSQCISSSTEKERARSSMLSNDGTSSDEGSTHPSLSRNPVGSRSPCPLPVGSVGLSSLLQTTSQRSAEQAPRTSTITNAPLVVPKYQSLEFNRIDDTLLGNDLESAQARISQEPRFGPCSESEGTCRLGVSAPEIASSPPLSRDGGDTNTRLLSSEPATIKSFNVEGSSGLRVQGDADQAKTELGFLESSNLTPAQRVRLEAMGNASILEASPSSKCPDTESQLVYHGRPCCDHSDDRGKTSGKCSSTHIDATESLAGNNSVASKQQKDLRIPLTSDRASEFSSYLHSTTSSTPRPRQRQQNLLGPQSPGDRVDIPSTHHALVLNEAGISSWPLSKRAPNTSGSGMIQNDTCLDPPKHDFTSKDEGLNSKREGSQDKSIGFQDDGRSADSSNEVSNLHVSRDGRSTQTSAKACSPERSPSSAASLPQRREVVHNPSLTPDRKAQAPSHAANRSARGPKDFEFGEILGEGSYSTVLEAWDLLSEQEGRSSDSDVPIGRRSAADAIVGAGQVNRSLIRKKKKVYAIKVLDKVHILKEKKQKYVAVEKEALSRLIRLPGVITLFWTFQDRESLYFVLDLAVNGELLGFIKKHGSFDVESSRYYAAQLCDTIGSMHEAGVLHRDIKPENVLLDASMKIKVTDFGSAKLIDPEGGKDKRVAQDSEAALPERTSSFVGTAEYVSPELLTEKAVSEASDLWSFGCVLYQMLAGRPPFKGPNEYQTFQKIIKKEYAFPDSFDPMARNLVDGLLVLDPKERFDIHGVKSHPFFASLDFSQVWRETPPEIRTGITPPASFSNQESSVSSAAFDSIEWDENDDSIQRNTLPGQTQSGASSLNSEKAHGAYPSHRIAQSSTADADADDSNLSDDSGRSGESKRNKTALVSTATRKRGSGLFRLVDSLTGRDKSQELAGRGRPLPSQPDGLEGYPLRHRVSNLSVETSGSSRSASRQNAASEDKEGHHSAIAGSTIRRLSQGGYSYIGSSTSQASNWGALLLPSELLLYSCPVIHRRTGAGNMFSKRRQLILTDFPRLLCVKETTSTLKVKSEVILAMPPSKSHGRVSTASHSDGDATDPKDQKVRILSQRAVDGTLRSSEDFPAREEERHDSEEDHLGPNVLIKVEGKGPKTFVIHTPSKFYVYEDPSGDASGWIKNIQEVQHSKLARAAEHSD
ncbi:hypothetical protein IE53DRAFT_196725 [Violaceomyces palustris]|uniref:Uncharacterized protein n=1 Tax=Violaceomyces palustris TaxID=1673888 RepID=A0ACD0P5C7_9BASI|nr:hypothetical protein IE53DRAFT_196725 [Violaceomyces palustris]